MYSGGLEETDPPPSADERVLARLLGEFPDAVIVIDAYHFGRRAPRGLGGLPLTYDPATRTLRAGTGEAATTVTLEAS